MRSINKTLSKQILTASSKILPCAFGGHLPCDHGREVIIFVNGGKR